jgi:hypothetical protein
MESHKSSQQQAIRAHASDYSRWLKRVVSLQILLVALVLALASCTSVSDATFINAGGLLLQHELGNNYSKEVGPYGRWGPEWQKNSSSKGVLAPEQMPDWAREQYVACVYWEDEFHTESSVSQPGTDMIRIRHGSGWGWVLLSEDLSFHILETNLRWTITEDGEQVESFNQTFVDAWDAPDES